MNRANPHAPVSINRRNQHDELTGAVWQLLFPIRLANMERLVHELTDRPDCKAENTMAGLDEVGNHEVRESVTVRESCELR